MAKYSYEFKMQIVLEYIQGDIGYKALAKKYRIPNLVLSKDGLSPIRSTAKKPFTVLANW